MVESMPHVVRSVPEAQLRLIGPVPETNRRYAQELEGLVGELGMRDHVAFFGSTDDPVAAYCSGTIAVLSSISEGFPYGVLEPMACGRAVVATNVGGVPEVVGDAGLLVPSRNPHAMADACVLLLSDAGERLRLAALGRARVEHQFSLGRMIDRFRDSYATVASMPNVRAQDAHPGAEDREPVEVELRERIGPYLPSPRGPEWAYDLIRAKVQG